MVFPNKAGQKNAGQKLTEHYLLNELWSELDETSQAAMSGGVTGAGIFLFEVSKGGRSTSNITNSTFANNSAGSGYTML